MDSQQVSGQQQQIIRPTTTANAADVVCPPAEDHKPTFGNGAAAAGGYVIVGVQPSPCSTISSQRSFVDSYEVQQSRGLGYALIVIGVASMICHAVSISKTNWLLILVGHGFWCGIVFMITGCFGVWAAEKVRRIVTAFFVLCILSAALSICLFVLSVAAAYFASEVPFFHEWGESDVVRITQSFLATFAVAAGVLSVRGIFICRRAVRLCPTCTSAFGVPEAAHPSGLMSIEQQLRQQEREKMLQPQPQFLLQQLQPLPQTATSQCPVVLMIPPQAHSPSGTPMYCQMPMQASTQQMLFPPTLQPLQTAMPSSNQGVVYMMIPAAAAAAATSSIGGPGSLVAAHSNGTTAPPPYPTAC